MPEVRNFEMTQTAQDETPGEALQFDAGAESKLFIGRTLENVTIESLIAVGGMGVIYLGKEKLTDRDVAVKILRPERQRSDRDREYFVREAQALSQIRHPNLVELYHVGMTEDGRHYMILEYVPGRTLREIVEEEGALPPLRCVRLFRQLLLALEATHAHGILHRDLKPDNLLIEKLQRGKERLRLADLGLVKFTQRQMTRLTDVGMTVGTPCYMSPEQVRGMDLDPRSDLYTTGVLMFEALTTYLPYPKARDVDELLDHILEATPAKLTRANPDFGRLPELQRLLDRLLHKNPAERPRTAAEVIDVVDRILETELSGDIKAALQEHEKRYGDDGSFIGALRSGVELSETEIGIRHRQNTRKASTPRRGIVVAVRAVDRQTGSEAAPPPSVLRKLRTWLETGGELVAAQRKGTVATFALGERETTGRMLSGLAYLFDRVSEEELALCAGVCSGPFEVGDNSEPSGQTVQRAVDYARRAGLSGVLACGDTVRKHHLA